MFSKLPALGIDLGTTNSCIGIWKNGQIDIIPNNMGNRVTPSIVSFEGDKIIVGEGAKNLLAKNPKNTIFEIKRIIGRKYDEEIVQKDIFLWPFKVIKEPEKGNPKVEVSFQGAQKSFYPEQISAEILRQLKEDAKVYYGREIKDAIITVPAYFNEGQRQATKDAGEIAGLNVLRVLNEPTAAAMAYGLENRIKKEQKILVFDLGGGTFDVSLLDLDQGIFDVVGTKGDTHLGGVDFDNKLVDYCIEEFKKKTGYDIKGNEKARGRLKKVCELAKINLTSCTQTSIDVDALYKNEDFSINISRAKFEDLCKDYFQKCINIVEELLKDTDTEKRDVDEIVLVGGSSKMPKIESLIKQYFNGKEPNKNINPDEAVAYGAAVQGAKINNVNDDYLKELTLLDVNPLPLGVEVLGHKFSIIIQKNSHIPITKNDIYSTAHDYQSGVVINVYEGENDYVLFNRLLGTFSIENIPIKRAGEVKFNVTFEIDINCILHVTAVEISQGKSNQITITSNKGNLTQEEIEELKNEALYFNANNNSKLSNETQGDGLFSSINQGDKFKLYEGFFKKERKIKDKVGYAVQIAKILEDNIELMGITKDSINQEISESIIKKFKIILNKLYRYYAFIIEKGRKKYKKSEYEEKMDEIFESIEFYNKIMKDYEIEYVLSLMDILINCDFLLICPLLIKLMRYYLNKGILLFNEDNYKMSKKQISECLNISTKYKLPDFQQKLKSEDRDEYSDIEESCNFYINRINSINFINEGKDFLRKGLTESEALNMDCINTALDSFRNALTVLHKSTNIIDVEYEAISLSFISKILHRIIKTKNTDNIYALANRSVTLALSLRNKNVETEKWYQDAASIVQEIRDERFYKEEKSLQELKEKVEKENPEIFQKINDAFNRGNIEFIKFILDNYPYNGYKKIDVEKEFKENTKKFIRILGAKYHPDGYEKNTKEEKIKYVIVCKISSLINNISSVYFSSCDSN